MKNASIFLLFALATVVLWALSSVCLSTPFRDSDVPRSVYFGLFMVPDMADLLAVLLFSGWAILSGRLGGILFTGPSARRFRDAATAFVVLLFLHVRGAFIVSNYGSLYLIEQFVFAVPVSLAAWYGLCTRGTNARNA